MKQLIVLFVLLSISYAATNAQIFSVVAIDDDNCQSALLMVTFGFESDTLDTTIDDVVKLVALDNKDGVLYSVSVSLEVAPDFLPGRNYAQFSEAIAVSLYTPLTIRLYDDDSAILDEFIYTEPRCIKQDAPTPQPTQWTPPTPQPTPTLAPPPIPIYCQLSACYTKIQ